MIPELCSFDGVSDEIRQNNFEMRKIFSTFRSTPQEKHECLVNIMNKLSQYTEFNDWDMSVGNYE